MNTQQVINGLKDSLATGLSIETWYYTAEDLISGKCPQRVIDLANAIVNADIEMTDKDILYMLRKDDVNAFKIRIKGAAGDSYGEMCLYTYHAEMDLNTGISIYDREEIKTYTIIGITDIQELLNIKAIATTTIPGRVYAPTGITKEVTCDGNSLADIEERWVLDISKEITFDAIFGN